jgi:hypothetical protein
MGARVIDLLAPLREVQGVEVQGTVELDLDVFVAEIANAYLEYMRDCLVAGVQPNGSPMPLNEQGDPRGTSGSGRLAEGLHIEISGTAHVIVPPLDRVEAAQRVYAGISLVNRAALNTPTMIEAQERALFKALRVSGEAAFELEDLGDPATADGGDDVG